MPLRALMRRVWLRYGRPVILAETSHIGVGRADWITEVTAETAAAIAEGVPVEGICLFPIIDRYDWGNSQHWHNSGLWDLDVSGGALERRLNLPYAAAIDSARRLLPG